MGREALGSLPLPELLWTHVRNTQARDCGPVQVDEKAKLPGALVSAPVSTWVSRRGWGGGAVDPFAGYRETPSLPSTPLLS